MSQQSVPDRILIVESDPIISDLISCQALQAAGYQTLVVADASSAIPQAIQAAPDVILADLNLPGLSAKDLMVALSSQNVRIPVIIIARKGNESDLVQAFRLGAADYLLYPMRETEVIAVVERALKQVHERREKELLFRRLQLANQELQARVRALTTIFAVGKAITSITDQSLLFEKILEAALSAVQADLGWFQLREDTNKDFILVAQCGLPPALAERLYQPWDDGIGNLIARSGETLSLHGEPIRRFKFSPLGQSVLIVPVKVQKQVIGLLTVMRREPLAFLQTEQRLLEAITDYAGISLANAHLFRTLESQVTVMQASTQNAQMGDLIAKAILAEVKDELRLSLDSASSSFDHIVKDPTARWNPRQRQALTLLQEQIQTLYRLAEAIQAVDINPHQGGHIAVNDLARQSAERLRYLALQNNLVITTDLPVEPIFARLDAAHITNILDGLISNAIQFSNPGGKVHVQVDKTPDSGVHILVQDGGLGIEARLATHIFDADYRLDRTPSRRFGGLGIKLSLIKEIVSNANGNIWVESNPGAGTSFHINLPAIN